MRGRTEDAFVCYKYSGLSLLFLFLLESGILVQVFKPNLARQMADVKILILIVETNWLLEQKFAD